MAVDTASYVWRIEQGETDPLTIPVTNGGSPMTVDGWTVDAKIRSNPGGPVLADLTELAEASGTNVVLTVPAVVSAAWTFSLGWFRVKITDPDSPSDDPTTYRVLQGWVLVDPD